MKKPSLFLGIDTSCDETSAAVVSVAGGEGKILSNVVSSQIKLHARFGGVVPELASRAHVERMAPVVRRALAGARTRVERLDGVAVTTGPGLVGALLAGVNFAKGLAWKHGLPLVPVHHIHAHLESVFLAHPATPLPSLALVVSGGHTALYLVTKKTKRGAPRAYTRVGTTRDDAVGEAYDKAAKMLGLGYPGGPIIERLALRGNPEALPLPRHPKIGKDVNYDFSLSGLKSALARALEKNPAIRPEDAAASFQAAAVEMLAWTTRRAARRFRPASLAVSGGVSVNHFLQKRLTALGEELSLPVFFPPKALTTDNGAMVAYAGALMRRSALRGAAALRVNARADWRL